MTGISIAAFLAFAPFTAFASGDQTVNPHPSGTVTCTAENTSHNSFTGTGDSVSEAQAQALKLCGDAEHSKGDCSIVACQ